MAAELVRLRGAVKVPPNSSNLAEARKRTLDFFKEACRALPAIMEIYNLHDVVTISRLRSTISQEMRKNANITNPKIIDMLLFKAKEELANIVDHTKQRHHIIGQYVLGRKGLVREVGSKKKDEGISDFLNKFYATNYF